jgi:hypothetical protein
MDILIRVTILLWIWMAYEIWRAPLLEMDDNGNWITKRPEKKLSDLFKKKIKK